MNTITALSPIILLIVLIGNWSKSHNALHFLSIIFNFPKSILIGIIKPRVEEIFE